MSGHDRKVCIVTNEVRGGAHVARVEFDEKQVAPNDSGFALFHEGFDAEGCDVDDFVVLCLHCAIDASPEAGAGMDAAKANVRPDGHGLAVLVGGEWRA